MGLFGKLAFWKKEDDFSDLGLGKPADLTQADFGPNMSFERGLEQGDETGLGNTGRSFRNTGQQPFDAGMQPDFDSSTGVDNYPSQQQSTSQSRMQQPPAPYNTHTPTPHEYMLSKDIEVISSKLDALRASLDSINQRLANLERMAESPRRGW